MYYQNEIKHSEALDQTFNAPPTPLLLSFHKEEENQITYSENSLKFKLQMV